MSNKVKCHVCGELTKNKKYCSRECQYESFRGEEKVERLEKECKNCGSTFRIRKSQTKNGRGKYCSRECVDERKKVTYKGSKNPMFGKTLSEKRKESLRENSVSMWKKKREKIEKRISESKENFFKKHGCYPGHTEKAKKKRRNTLKEKYNKEHNWEGEFGERKCDKTTKKKYGKSSLKMCLNSSRKNKKGTSIECKIIEILDKNKVSYKKQFSIKKFIVDFYLPNQNLVIEADGDYWHGNPNKYNEFDKIQKKRRKIDKRKNNTLKKLGYNLIRFWGSEIKNSNFEKKLLENIKKYE